MSFAEVRELALSGSSRTDDALAAFRCGMTMPIEETKLRPTAVATRRAWSPPSVARPVSLEWVRPELRDLFPGVPINLEPHGRKPVARGMRSYVPGRSEGETIVAASKLEKRFAMQAEIEWGTVEIVMQPCRVRYLSSATSKWAYHQPDVFGFERTPPHRFVEIKYETDAARFEDRWKAIGPAFAAAGFRYEVITERILDGTPSRNVRLVWRDRHVTLPSTEDLERSLRSLRVGDASTLRDIEIRCPNLDRRQIHALVRLGVFSIDRIDRPLDEDAVLRFRGGNPRRFAEGFRIGNRR